MLARSSFDSSSARSQYGIASANSSRSMYSSAKNSWNVGVGRVQLGGTLQPGEGIVGLPFAHQGQPEVGVSLGQIGFQPQGFQIGGPRLDVALELPQGVAEVVVQGRHVRLKPDRFLAVRQGLFRLAPIQEHLAQVRQGGSISRVQFHGAAEVLQRLVVLVQAP